MNRRTFSAILLALPTLGACAIMPLSGGPSSKPVSLQMDYEGAEALLAVLDQPRVSDADIDRLLTICGVAAMVDNTTRYIPSHTRGLFRSAVKEGSPLYFVGYEMAKAIDARYGPGRIGSFVNQHSVAFFSTYISLYQECPSYVPAKFSPATEAHIAAISGSQESVR